MTALGRSRDPGHESCSVVLEMSISKALQCSRDPEAFLEGEMGMVKFGFSGTGIKELFLIRDTAGWGFPGGFMSIEFSHQAATKRQQKPS